MVFRQPAWVCVFATLIVLAPVTITAPPVGPGTDVLTWHNDLARTGQNLTETILTPANVNSTNFGKLFVVSIDGQVYAQPLVVSGLSIPGQNVRDVLYIATEHDTVYACDANDGTLLWQNSMLAAGETPYPGCLDGTITTEIGITATPVIDRTSGPNGTIYVEAMSKDAANNTFHRLHALDLATGAEQFSGPVNIAATYPGTGDNSDGVNVIFDPKQYKVRPGLVLNGGIIYLAFGWRCGGGGRPFTGWVLGYDEATLAQVAVLNLTPNGYQGSIWAGGAAPAVDANGCIYLMTADGAFETTLDANGFPNQGDYGNAFVKLSTANNTLQVADYWTMFNNLAESNTDTDLGSGGPIVLPDMIDNNGAVRHLAVGAGKDAHIYVVDRDNMGKFDPNSNSTIYQDLPGLLGGREFGAPAYFNGTLYFGPVKTNLRAFTFTNARVNSIPASITATSFPYPGTIPSVSANGASNGIVWALENGAVAVLHAYDATDLARELYNSNQAANSRDQFGAGNKFAVPTIANGKVYVGSSSGSVAAFGLLNPSPTPTPTPTPTATPTPTSTPTPIQVTVQTNPAGLNFTVDGTAYSAAQTFSWTPGSSHAIATTNPQSGGTGIDNVRYAWASWSDSKPISHSIAPSKNTTYTAKFNKQYYLTMSAGVGGSVSPASGWKNSGTAISISATPVNNSLKSYNFSGWTGVGTGSYSGANNPASIAMSGPITEGAAFTQNPVQVTVQTNPAGRSFSVDGTTYTAAQSFSWDPGSSHAISTTSPQNSDPGIRYVWMNWNDNKPTSHTVAPTTNTTYTANFRTQYYLTMSSNTGGTVTPASGWKVSGATISIRATPSSVYHFTNWTGIGTGSYSGTNNPASITMGGPITETATFTHN